VSSTAIDAGADHQQLVWFGGIFRVGCGLLVAVNENMIGVCLAKKAPI
jgi:hypothetical protein